jgi:hypothetical protein
MRLSLFCWIGLALMMAGCCSHESASTTDPNAKSADAECKSGDCCSSVSRSSLLSSPRPGTPGRGVGGEGDASDESK